MHAHTVVLFYNSDYKCPSIQRLKLEYNLEANLKNAIRVEVSSRDAENDVDASFLDGCAVVGSTLTDIWHSARLSGPIQQLHT